MNFRKLSLKESNRKEEALADLFMSKDEIMIRIGNVCFADIFENCPPDAKTLARELIDLIPEKYRHLISGPKRSIKYDFADFRGYRLLGLYHEYRPYYAISGPLVGKIVFSMYYEL